MVLSSPVIHWSDSSYLAGGLGLSSLVQKRLPADILQLNGRSLIPGSLLYGSRNANALSPTSFHECLGVSLTKVWVPRNLIKLFFKKSGLQTISEDSRLIQQIFMEYLLHVG